MENKILIFEQFLIGYGVDIREFKEACLYSDDNFTVKSIFKEQNIETFLRDNRKTRFIIDAFDWALVINTFYWSNLNNNWIRLCEKHIDENIYFGFGIDYSITSVSYLTITGLKIKL